MSLILEALRKSEAERRRGDVPNVYMELPPSPRTRQAGIPIWAWLLLAGAVLLVAVWLARGFMLRESTPKVAAVAPSTNAATSRQSALPPVSHLSPTPVAVPMPAPAVVSKPVEPVHEATANTPLPAVIVEAAPRATLPIAAAVAEPADTGTLQLSDLSVDERKALPPLKLSMHMWNDDPAQRFVILDGNRLREGDRIGDAVVTAITANAVVLDWNGRRLKLPIR